MFRRILRAYDLAPTQVAPNGWSQMVGGMYLWFRHSFGMEMPLHVFQTDIPAEEEGQGGGSWGNWQRVYDDPGVRFGRAQCVWNSQPLTSSRAVKREHRRAPAKQRPRTLVPGSADDTSQRKVIEDLSRAGNKEVAEAPKVIEVDDVPEVEVPLSRERKARPSGVGPSQATADAVEIAGLPTTCGVPPLQRTLAVNTAGEVILEGPPKSTPAPESGSGGPYDSKRRLRELIGGPGVRIPDESLRNVPFYPSYGCSGGEEVLHSQVGGVLLSRKAGGCVESELGFGHKGICDANEGPG
ncbi:hypothetical protein Adt_15111 [Abeliophyllum distichum]|uniref:Aminotransferase-like plant mobile domain-containing protein n=1 Tax=Abeliophyllum distichum TaxID=126358 RepID=A0ABD1U1K3_9LAMI